MDQVYFLVLNKDNNPTNWDKMDQQLKVLTPNYKRIRAIEGSNLENDPQSLETLNFIDEPGGIYSLKGNSYYSLNTNDVWVYDCTVYNSFPGIHRTSEWDTKATMLDNVYALHYFNTSPELVNFKYVCILNDNVLITETIFNTIIEYIANNDDDIYLFDENIDNFFAVGYKGSFIYNLLDHMHPLSTFGSIQERLTLKPNSWGTNLTTLVKSPDYLPAVKYSSCRIVPRE